MIYQQKTKLQSYIGTSSTESSLQTVQSHVVVAAFEQDKWFDKIC